MPLMRWSTLNASRRSMRVTVTLFNGSNVPVPWTGCPPNAAQQLAPGAGPAHAGTAATGGLWAGYKVGVQVEDVGLAVPAPWAIHAVPLGSSRPDNVRDIRVLLEDDPVVSTNVLATVWGLDGLGAWWLLCDRTSVNVT